MAEEKAQDVFHLWYCEYCGVLLFKAIEVVATYSNVTVVFNGRFYDEEDEVISNVGHADTVATRCPICYRELCRDVKVTKETADLIAEALKQNGGDREEIKIYITHLVEPVTPEQIREALLEAEI